MLFTQPTCFYTYTTHLLCMYTHVYVYVCVRICIYIYIYIYIYKVKVKFSRYRPGVAQKWVEV